MFIWSTLLRLHLVNFCNNTGYILRRYELSAEDREKGIDPRRLTAQRLFGRAEISDEERKLGKSINFMAIYSSVNRYYNFNYSLFIWFIIDICRNALYMNTNCVAQR